MKGLYSIWALLLVLVGRTLANPYYMDGNDCNNVGVQQVPRESTVTVYAKKQEGIAFRSCSITLRAVDGDATLEVSFSNFFINDPGVTLSIYGNTDQKEFGSGTRNPGSVYTSSRSVTITLAGTSINRDYNFIISVKAIRPNLWGSETQGTPGLGLVFGIVGGVLGFLIFIAILSICCFKKYRGRRQPFKYPEMKEKLADSNPPAVSVGYTNESLRNGPRTGSPSTTKKLLAPSDSSEEKSDNSQKRPGKLNNTGNGNNTNGRFNKSPPDVSDFVSSPGKKRTFDYGDYREERVQGGGFRREPENERPVDVDTGRPRNPMLNALHSNSKFKETFEKTEADAEERAKRISTSSSASLKELGEAPGAPSRTEGKAPKLPPVQRSPKSKKKDKTAGIRRAPRPTSSSSEELAKIARGAPGDDSDRNINVLKLRDSDVSTPSSSELDAIESLDPKRKKGNTEHSLKPNRGKGKGGKKKDIQGQPPPPAKVESLPQMPRLQSVDRVLNDSGAFEKTPSGRFVKKASKSPKTRRDKKGTGFSHRRSRSDSRPETPTDLGSDDDLESLPGLIRSSSKQSLYSSRSSLYDRRGRRRKGSAGSVSSSVYNYPHDDMEVGRHSREYYDNDSDFDGYERPISRRDRERMFRSAGDLDRESKTCATQTLRETATQTGQEQSVMMQPKRLVKKKRRSKSMSTAETQTAAKKKGKREGLESNKADSQSTGDSDDETKAERRKKAKSRSKSAVEGKGETSKPKVKPKPKPVPRKSTSAENILKMDSPDTGLVGQGQNMPPGQGLVAPNYEGQNYGGMPMQGQFYPGQSGIPMGMPPPPNYPSYPQGGHPSYPMANYPPPAADGRGGTLPSQGYNIPGKPRKSNWEMLCELTDGQMPGRDMTETGSVSSSVFTNNPPSAGYTLQPGNQPVGYYPQDYNQGYQAQYNQGFPPPPNNLNQPPNQFPPPMQPGYNVQSGPGSQGRGPSPQPQVQRVPNVSTTETREKPMTKMSSWEVLKQITDQQSKGSSSSSNEERKSSSSGERRNVKQESVV